MKYNKYAQSELTGEIYNSKLYSTQELTVDNKKEEKGVFYKGKKYTTHTNLDLKDSALVTFVSWQKYFIILFIFICAISIALNPLQTLIIILAALTIVYFADFVFSSTLIFKSLRFPPEIFIEKPEIDKIDEKNLPLYSILCPLYKEANVIEQFVEGIDSLDWPKNKLEVLLLLEEDDTETIDRARQLMLPSHFKIVIVPHSFPKTKPKACNYGFSLVKGEYIVIYDAEDKPERDQLKKAYLAFNKSKSNVICLQSKLNYYNKGFNLLTKLFTAEYSLWFDLILPGLQSIETTIPLGGTSNHFKKTALKYLCAWDPFNVTEDCDLGTRLFKEGFKTAIINSTTYEEANSKLKSWIKQRSRWIKGYMQTYLVHMRDPIGFYKRHGIHSIIFQLVIGMRMTFMLINPILWTITISYFAFRSSLGAYIELLYSGAIYYIAVFCLVFGNFVYFYNYMIGLAKRRQWDLIKYVFFVPLYWILTSAAAVIAFYQLFIKPYYWEKTQHGLHLSKKEIKSAKFRVDIDLSFPFKIPSIDKLKHKVGDVYFAFIRNLYDFLDLFGELPSIRNPRREKLKILILNWRDTKHVWAGGAEVYIHEIGKNLVKEGHSVTIFCGWDGKTSRNDNIDNITILRRGGFFTVYLFAFLYYVFKFRDKFDIILDCENGIPFFSACYSITPIVLLIHHVHKEVLMKYLKFPLSIIGANLENKLMPLLYKNIPTVTVSESSKKEIVLSNLTTSDNINIVNPGVDFTKFQRGKKTSYPSFIYFGRLQHYKNIDLAIKAFSEIQNKYHDAKLDIVGFGEDFESLTSLVKRLNLEDCITFYGRVKDSVRSNLLSRSWAAIQPSSFEGWGITVIEANAAGTCVIASNVSGLKDSVVNNKTGLLFTSRNVSSLVEAMEKIISDPALQEQLSRNAYLWAQNFSWENSSAMFEKIFSKVLAKRSSKRYLYQNVVSSYGN